MGWWKGFIFLVFPLYLIAVEAVLRFLISNPDVTHADAPFTPASAICVAGISLMAPVLVPKPVVLAPEVAAHIAKYGFIVRHGDKFWIPVAGVTIFVATLAWGVVLWMIQNPKHAPIFAIYDERLPFPSMIGFFIYLFGVGLAQMKERV